MTAKQSDEFKPHIGFGRRVFWTLVWFVSLIWFKLCYRFRVVKLQPLPQQGPVLYVTNHQSFLDPQIIGVASFPRPCFSMARATLWNSRILGPIITALNAIPVQRSEDGGQQGDQRQAIQHCLAVLNAGHALNLFPEGTRTTDGSVGEFSPGIMLLIKRAKPTVIPVGISGAYNIWPRSQSKPKFFGKLKITFGEHISADELLEVKTKEAVTTLQQGVADLVEKEDA